MTMSGVCKELSSKEDKLTLVKPYIAFCDLVLIEIVNCSAFQQAFKPYFDFVAVCITNYFNVFYQEVQVRKEKKRKREEEEKEEEEEEEERHPFLTTNKASL